MKKFSSKDAALVGFLFSGLVGSSSLAEDTYDFVPNIPTPVEQNGHFVNQDSYSYTAPSAGYSLGVQPIYNSDTSAPVNSNGEDAYMEALDKVGVSVGAAGIYGPKYQGSKDYEFAPVPSISIKYDDKIFASTRDGVGYNFIQNKDLTMTAALGYDPGRRQKESSKLNGLGDVDSAYTANLLAEYRIYSFSNDLAISTDPFNQGAGGYTVRLASYYNMSLADKLNLGVGPSATWGSADYMKSYFGIDQTQANNSGYRFYSPSDGFKDVSLNTRMGYKLDDKTLFYGNASYTRLVGDAADSPVSQTDDNYFMGLGIDYKLY